MNSVDRHLNAATKAATLLAMRSARKEVFLVVEGDEDVRLFSNMLGLSTSNIISCDTKEVLMELAQRDIEKGLDEGTIFIRDRDFDDISTHKIAGRLIVVTEHYDIELDLLSVRIFRRIFNELGNLGDEDVRHAQIWKLVISVGARLGALRWLSSTDGLGLDFKNLKFPRFIKANDLKISDPDMVKYIAAKSKISLDVDDICNKIEEKCKTSSDAMLCRGKDILSLLEIVFTRVVKFCNFNEASSSAIARFMRVSATVEDFSRLALYPSFRDQVEEVPFSWQGRPLP